MFKVFSVYDSKAEFYSPLHNFRTTQEGIRSFSRAANDSNSVFFHHPEDFTLFEIGTFDELTGVVQMYKAPVAVARMIELVKPASSPNPVTN